MTKEMLGTLFENERRGSVVLDDEGHAKKDIEALEKLGLVEKLWFHLEDSGCSIMYVCSFELTTKGNFIIAHAVEMVKLSLEVSGS